MAYSMAGMAVFALVGAANYAAKKRRCRSSNDEDEKSAKFVEMRDAAIV
eukprot:CAMPEP_0172565706 /NCGR_PEP_ID=MMETSP1067-20121228/109232_1 /TAXON_ID=265564 ORGANISM="Thalassiosira punctigera, Strain Tpunct2005C2" /NCGR_SAMPLE_ID=MMETSP1067 /ASSEMBLY_ACC=CAM_ASM_000444 /LENGTH=48 /DNA_ID= /DNA_START= /DNA_END= /DNA_ORIENTATION=